MRGNGIETSLQAQFSGEESSAGYFGNLELPYAREAREGQAREQGGVKLLAVFLVAVASAAAPDFEQFKKRFRDLDQTHQDMVQTWCGWASQENHEAVCRLDPNKLDYALYAKARKAAMVFYDLKDKE